jgi:hypothetical protein
MSLVNKSFKNKITGDTFRIVDVYQNIAITDNREKIDTKLLMNDKLFVPVSNELRESFSLKKNDDYVDPQNFFENQNAYNYLAETIKKIDTSRIKEDNSNANVNYSKSDFDVSNESAIVYSDPEDEIEELKRKYGATSVDDSLRKQNEAFAKILDPQSEVQSIEVPRDPVVQEPVNQPPIQRVDVVDPVTAMFRNVKRNINFNIDLKIEGKIPRLDFIEMMEDSYEISIIDYLAEEFTNNILSDPSIIRNKIKSEIRSMIDKKNGNLDRKIPEVKKEDREVLNEGVPTPVKTEKRSTRKKNISVPPPPVPPKDRLLKEGKEPEPPKSMNVE